MQPSTNTDLSWLVCSFGQEDYLCARESCHNSTGGQKKKKSTKPNLVDQVEDNSIAPSTSRHIKINIFAWVGERRRGKTGNGSEGRTWVKVKVDLFADINARMIILQLS